MSVSYSGHVGGSFLTDLRPKSTLQAACCTLASIMTRYSTPSRLILLLTMLVGFGLRLYRLGVDSLWYDETVSALLAAKPLAAMWQHTAGDIHPPLYYALLHIWTLGTGRYEYALAFLSVWFGIALIPPIALLTARLYGPRTSLMAAFLLAVNPFSIWYAQEVRMYTLGAFLLAITLLVTVTYFRRPYPRSLPILGLYAIFAAAALWTLYYTAFALLALNAFAIIWLALYRRRQLPAWLAAQGVALLLFLPWLPIAVRQALNPPVPPWRTAPPLGQLLADVLRESVTALNFGQSLDANLLWPWGMVGVILAGLAFLARARPLAPQTPRRYTPVLLWTVLLGPLLIIVILSLVLVPYYHVRYLYLFSISYPVLLAAGLLYLAGMGDSSEREPVSRLRVVVAGVLIAALLAGSWRSLSNYHRQRFTYEAADDLRGAVANVESMIGPRDAILINAGYLYPALLHYWSGDLGWLGRLSNYPPPPEQIAEGPMVILTGHVDGPDSLGWSNPESDFFSMSREEVDQHLTQVFADHNTVWVIRGYDTVTDPQGDIRTWLEEHGTLYHDQVFPGQTFLRTQAWRTTTNARQVPPPFAISQPLDFTGGIRFLGYDRSPVSLGAGERLRLTLYWQQSGIPIASDYTVFVQLLNDRHEVIAQDDAQPGRGSLPTTTWENGEIVESTFVLALPNPLPPGTYRLITGFYDRETGQRLALVSGNDAAILSTELVQP